MSHPDPNDDDPEDRAEAARPLNRSRSYVRRIRHWE